MKSDMMNSKREEIAVPAHRTADDLLAELARFGHPRLFQFARNPRWFAKVILVTPCTGADFGIEGDGDTPNEALTKCLENLQAARKALGQ